MQHKSAKQPPPKGVPKGAPKQPATKAAKPMLRSLYTYCNPQTLRERERQENQNRCRKCLGNWPPGYCFSEWGKRNKTLRETSLEGDSVLQEARRQWPRCASAAVRGGHA